MFEGAPSNGVGAKRGGEIAEETSMNIELEKYGAERRMKQKVLSSAVRRQLRILSHPCLGASCRLMQYEKSCGEEATPGRPISADQGLSSVRVECEKSGVMGTRIELLSNERLDLEKRL